MSVRGMADNLVDNDFETVFMGARYQAVIIFKCSEHRIDILKIADVITKIVHRRLEKRRQPDCINPEIGNIPHFTGNAWQVTYTVPV